MLPSCVLYIIHLFFLVRFLIVGRTKTVTWDIKNERAGHKVNNSQENQQHTWVVQIRRAQPEVKLLLIFLSTRLACLKL